MWGRGVRCSVCGGRPAADVPAAEFVLTDAVRRRAGPPYRLCETCLRSNTVRRRRQAAEQEALAAQRNDSITRLAPDGERWLRDAPLLETLPAETGSYDEMFPRHPFVEVMDLAAAARHVAAVKLGHAPGRSLVFRFYYTTPEPPFPSRYEEAIIASDHRYGVPLHLYAAVHRLPDGDVAFHWRRTGEPPP